MLIILDIYFASAESVFRRKIPCQVDLFGVSDTIPGVNCLGNDEPDLFQKYIFQNYILSSVIFLNLYLLLYLHEV